MTKLKLVPKTEPTEAQKIHLRMKNRPRPEGMLQCNRCGCRSLVTVKHGVIIKNGRKQGGTVIVKDLCEFCWKQGIFSEMIPQLKPTK